MYHVVGRDGVQYGPVDEATLREWIAQGRIGAESLTFRTGESQWVPLRERSGFAGIQSVPVPPAPPRGVPVTGDEPKDWLVTLLLSIFLGWLGVDRFYMGNIGLGIAKLLTGAGCGIWWLIDVILIATGSVRDGQGRPLVKS
jgi:hypothetical protein